MRKLIIKVAFLVIVVYGCVVGGNYVVDPAYIYHTEIIDEMVEVLSDGKIIENPGDFDEGLFMKGMVEALDAAPKTLILGSSHTMYVPWEENYEGVFVGGMSGAYLGDFYAVLGLLESGEKGMPERVVIGVDPWAFCADNLFERHPSISKYARYEKSIVDGKEEEERGMSVNGTGGRKLRGLFSFSYFQSSFAKLREKGIGYYLNQRHVSIVTDDSVGNIAKILPNGRWVMGSASYKSVAENNAKSQNAIEAGVVYPLPERFIDLQENNLNEFKNMVEYLQKKDVEVEVYLPTWYPPLYTFFEREEGFAGVIKVEEYIRKFGKSHNIVVHGSYNPEVSDVSEEDFADWFHLKQGCMLDNYNVIIQ